MRFKDFFNIFRYNNWVDWLNGHVLFQWNKTNQLLLTNLLGGWWAQWNFSWNRVQEKTLKRDANGDLDPDLQTKSLPLKNLRDTSIVCSVYGSIFTRMTSTHSHIHGPQVMHVLKKIVPGSLCPACIGWNPTSWYHESQSHLTGVDFQWKLTAFDTGFSENRMSFGWKC